MTHLAQFAESRDSFFRQHGYLPNTVSISAPNLQAVRAESQFLIEGLAIKRRQGSEIEFSHEEKIGTAPENKPNESLKGNLL